MEEIENKSTRPSFRLLDLFDGFYGEIDSRNASGLKTSPSSLLRDLVRDGLKPERRRSAEQLALLRQEIYKLRRELAPVGGNLNQLAHLFNTGHPVNMSELDQQHQELRSSFSSLVKVLDELIGEIR